MNNIREKYLNNLNNEFNLMMDLLQEQMNLVKNKLQNGKEADISTAIITNEHKIDQLQNTLRNDIINAIALQNPKAGDLRRIMACYDAVVDMERSADILESISKRLTLLENDKSILTLFNENILQTFLYAEKMMINVIHAFVREDVDVAFGVISSDDKLDFLHRTSIAELSSKTYSAETYPNYKAEMLQIGRIYYGIERIGDKASNIAESIIFAANGENINHSEDIF